MEKADITIVGAGIVGLATAYQLSQHNPRWRIVVVDKEQEVAAHQTGHNSGVIHSGIYYTPGGSKAVNCRKGYGYLLDFAQEHNIPHDVCGKVIVATQEWEVPLLQKIFERGQANGLDGIRMISREETAEIEPHVAAIQSIWVPQSGIIDYAAVARKYMELVEEKGGIAKLGQALTGVESRPEGIVVQTERSTITTRVLINCAGLYADKIAALSGDPSGLQIIPFRGEYYQLIPEREYLVNNLIYPVPNPNFPFLGVHYTRMIRGGIEAGPSAVLAFQREGYSRWQVNLGEFMEIWRYPGFRKLAARFWKTGLDEMHRSFSKRAFVSALSHLIPEVGMKDLVRAGAGVRAQAIDREGNLVDDFLIREKPGIVNVLNAPSPAATSSLAIGEMVASYAIRQLEA
jgi:L-2-hydroxyglutarate oxidase